MEKTMVRQAVPLQPMEVDGGADIHLQPVEDPMPEQVDAPKGGCDPVGSLHWSRFAGRTCAPMGDPCWSSLVLKNCTLWKGPTLEQFMKNCSP
ncbi:AN1-type zinc finger protein 5-like [Grus japonensis]|uniref:AN1-type zinc finger protein 5-like n=1 Tax=Grus japonensis TaxID=30415 RepID=A0ABC9X0A1_GRUJA